MYVQRQYNKLLFILKKILAKFCIDWNDEIYEHKKQYIIYVYYI